MVIRDIFIVIVYPSVASLLFMSVIIVEGVTIRFNQWPND